MILKEMNLSTVPDKLPNFMMKYGNEMIDGYFDVDEEQMEFYPDSILKQYKLTKSGSDSFAYVDSVQKRILEAFTRDSELIHLLCSDQKRFLQAMKGVPTDILLNKLYFVSAENKNLPNFEDFTVYDFAVALNYIALLVCMKNREDEIQEHCDMINDFIEQTQKVKGNVNYESLRRNRRKRR